MDWHYGGDFPTELPDKNGGTHIGMYLAWIVNNNLVGELHLNESLEAVEKVKARHITGTDFLVDECDEKLWDEELNDEGLAFTEEYYSGGYMNDYVSTLAEELPTAYHVEDTWTNYDLLARVLDRRFSEWKRKKNPKKWWPFRSPSNH